MRSHIGIWWLLAVFFAVLTVGYTVWNLISHGEVEWVGTMALLFSIFMAAMVAFYVQLVYRAQKGVELPEDRDDADIDDGDSEMGEFSPWSWWPIVLAGSAAVAIVAIAVGATFLLPIGIGVLVIAIVGWVYEYYRGYFAR
ncbi:aa3-type cytochrome oxidase subunit IV [Microbacterium album]|uniref:Cytochrome c oxidase polypeptide 4 n=1 Tax=Microbacterium album TaxID=2053191 RepID=A0A917IF35_9MICO|nr:cytochrome c oxidase subunit 4 [Microbacterium album]GGH40276.1 putative cytochrome c oxidase polypeptide 4 [Microbacterium album]